MTAPSSSVQWSAQSRCAAAGHLEVVCSSCGMPSRLQLASLPHLLSPHECAAQAPGLLKQTQLVTVLLESCLIDLRLKAEKLLPTSAMPELREAFLVRPKLPVLQLCCLAGAWQLTSPLMRLQMVRQEHFTGRVSMKSILLLGFHVLKSLTVHLGDLTSYPLLHKLLTIKVRCKRVYA